MALTFEFDEDMTAAEVAQRLTMWAANHGPNVYPVDAEIAEGRTGRRLQRLIFIDPDVSDF